MLHFETGTLKVWEYSSGMELKSYVFEHEGDEDDSVIWVTYLQDEAAKVYHKLFRKQQNIC